MRLNQRLIEFMEVKNLSRDQIAKVIELDPTNISKWTKKEQEFPLKHVIKLCESYPELNIRWFLTGNGPMLLTGSEENPYQVNETTLPYNQKCTNPACIKEIEYLQNRAEELRADKIFLQETVEDLRRKVGTPSENTNSGSVEETRRTG